MSAVKVTYSKSKATGEKFIFFHTLEDPNAWCGNWYPCKFKDSNGTEFNSVEQYLMYHKAITFHDKEIAEKILKATDPAEIKALGRKVRNYDDKVWSKVRYCICMDGIRYKFLQNQDLLDALISADGTFAECAVKGHIWAIGMSLRDPDRFNKSKWKGTNYLGLALAQVRKDIMRERGLK